jgi:hypothetical protein
MRRSRLSGGANRNFHFASPISTPHLDQPASLGKVLAQFGPVLVRECLAAVVDTSLSGVRVVRELERLAIERAVPQVVVSDNVLRR